MNVWLHAAGIALILAIVVRQSALADEPAAKATDAKLAKDEAKPAAKVDAAEPLNLDALAAPLRALFGGAVAVPAANIPNAEDVEAQNDAMAQQFLQQLRPVLTSELGFVRLMCGDLNPEQRRTIKGRAEASLKQAVRQMADQQHRQQRGQAVKANAAADPRTQIRDAIAKALREQLTEERMTSFTEAATQRNANRKRATILSVVSRLDDLVCLTPDQRDKISAAIAAKWQDDWEKWLLMSQVYGNRYFPMVPDQCVGTHLNAEQKSVWQGVQKVDIGWWGHQQGQDPDNDGWWGNEPEKPNGPFKIGVAR